jgi:hypothetical protein
VSGRFAAASKDVSNSARKLRLPSRNLNGMDIEALAQFSERLIAFDRCKGHLSLESWCVVPARSSRHAIS